MFNTVMSQVKYSVFEKIFLVVMLVSGAVRLTQGIFLIKHQ